MSYPIIGSTWGIAPERLTLSEARKRESARLHLGPGIVSLFFNALKSFGGSHVG